MSAVGIIGLGAIGYPIAQRLLSNGYTLYTTVHSERSRSQAEKLHIQILESPKAFAQVVDTVIILVSNYEQCYDCLNSENGVLASMRRGTIILSSTIASWQMRQLAELCPKNVALLDAPVSGGVRGAADGTLVCMVAGDYESCRNSENLLSAYCKKIVYVGEQQGQAQMLKAINQMLVGIHIVATAEAENLASACGIDLQSMYDTISSCAGNSCVFQSRMPKLMKNDFAVMASAETMEKDTSICLELAKEANAPAFLTELCHSMFQQIISQDSMPEDACAVVKLYRKQGGSAALLEETQ